MRAMISSPTPRTPPLQAVRMMRTLYGRCPVLVSRSRSLSATGTSLFVIEFLNWRDESEVNLGILLSPRYRNATCRDAAAFLEACAIRIERHGEDVRQALRPAHVLPLKIVGFLEVDVQLFELLGSETILRVD